MSTQWGDSILAKSTYSEALRWVIKANKRIEEKKEVKDGYPLGLTDAVISKIADSWKS